MTGRRDHVYRVLAIVIAQECRKPLLLIDKTIVLALLLLSKRTAKPLSVVIRYIFIARKVQPVTVCLRPLTCTDLAGIKPIEIMWAAVIGPDQPSKRLAHSTTHFLRHVLILARLSFRLCHH